MTDELRTEWSSVTKGTQVRKQFFDTLSFL